MDCDGLSIKCGRICQIYDTPPYCTLCSRISRSWSLDQLLAWLWLIWGKFPRSRPGPPMLSSSSQFWLSSMYNVRIKLSKVRSIYAFQSRLTIYFGVPLHQHFKHQILLQSHQFSCNRKIDGDNYPVSSQRQTSSWEDEHRITNFLILTSFLSDPPGPTFLSYTPNGRRLVTAGCNTFIRIYETGSSGEPVNVDDCQENNLAVAATVWKFTQFLDLIDERAYTK